MSDFWASVQSRTLEEGCHATSKRPARDAPPSTSPLATAWSVKPAVSETPMTGALTSCASVVRRSIPLAVNL